MLRPADIVRCLRFQDAIDNPGTWLCQRCGTRYLHCDTHECESDREERLREVRTGMLLP